MKPDEQTDEMAGGPDEPTEVNSPGDEPTEVNSPGDEPTGKVPGQPTSTSRTGGANRGMMVLLAAVIASLALAGAYVAAGGPVGPSGASDPCDPRAWTNPGNLEESAQQFALSAADGAACELGVSREELIRSIAEEGSRQDFQDRHGFSDGDLEGALRSGLNRAVDDAENAGVLDGFAATGLRAAINVMPMSVMIDLLENSESIFNGDLGSLGGVSDALEAITNGVDELGSGEGGNPLDDLEEAIEGGLPEGTTDDLRELIPKETREQLEDRARERLQEGLDDLFGP